mmetsp:Transcript_32501/g.81454  ORF Transcript_32501/g.81454 Transcript_32501/m.81454 type:complete len:180 (+) Transcript_32501:120-659(+)
MAAAAPRCASGRPPRCAAGIRSPSCRRPAARRTPAGAFSAWRQPGAELAIRIPASVSSAAAAALLMLGGPSWAGEPPPTPGVDDSSSEFVQGLLAKSKENKAKNDSDRLYRFYHKEFAINKTLGKDVLPEPCDPQDPEFGGKCRPKLPRLPEERLDPSQPNPGFNGFGGLTPMNPVDDF